MSIPSDKESRFRNSIIQARAYRRELLTQLIDKVDEEDKKHPRSIPVNYGRLGDLELDISLLEQLLQIQSK